MIPLSAFQMPVIFAVTACACSCGAAINESTHKAAMLTVPMAVPLALQNGKHALIPNGDGSLHVVQGCLHSMSPYASSLPEHVTELTCQHPVAQEAVLCGQGAGSHSSPPVGRNPSCFSSRASAFAKDPACRRRSANELLGDHNAGAAG